MVGRRRSLVKFLMLLSFLALYFGLFALVQAYLVDQGVIPSMLGNMWPQPTVERAVVKW